MHHVHQSEPVKSMKRSLFSAAAFFLAAFDVMHPALASREGKIS
jgi:hypothetical protein